MADYVIGSPALFNEDTKFFKDVYIYGTLYYDFTKFDGPIVFDNITVNGNGYFGGDVYIEGNGSVGILTVRKRLDVGVGGTVIRAIADLDGLPFSTGKVGIGSTAPIQSLDVVGNAIISQNVGIGKTAPIQSLDVVGNAIISQNVGIGKTAPLQSLDVVGNTIISGNVGIGGTTIPQQRLEVGGSVKIDQYIYDSVNSPGKNGYQLARDEIGIRWIPIILDYAPGDPTGIGTTDGIFVLDEGIPLYP